MIDPQKNLLAFERDGPGLACHVARAINLADVRRRYRWFGRNYVTLKNAIHNCMIAFKYGALVGAVTEGHEVAVAEILSANNGALAGRMLRDAIKQVDSLGLSQLPYSPGWHEAVTYAILSDMSTDVSGIRSITDQSWRKVKVDWNHSMAASYRWFMYGTSIGRNYPTDINNALPPNDQWDQGAPSVSYWALGLWSYLTERRTRQHLRLTSEVNDTPISDATYDLVMENLARYVDPQALKIS